MNPVLEFFAIDGEEKKECQTSNHDHKGGKCHRFDPGSANHQGERDQQDSRGKENIEGALDQNGGKDMHHPQS